MVAKSISTPCPVGLIPGRPSAQVPRWDFLFGAAFCSSDSHLAGLLLSPGSVSTGQFDGLSDLGRTLNRMSLCCLRISEPRSGCPLGLLEQHSDSDECVPSFDSSAVSLFDLLDDVRYKVAL